MCDPASLISSGLGAGSKMMDAMGRQNAARKQDQANKQNAMMQLFLMDQHLKNQDRYRGQGEGMWSAALDDMSAGTQIARQSQEESRLASYLNGDTPAIIGAKDPASLGIKWWEDHPVSGVNGGIMTYTDQPTTDKTVVPPPSKDGGFSFDPNIAGSRQGGDVFQSDLAYKLNQAARGARGQINALARLSSYGGSYGGLGTVNPLILQNSSDAINMQNNFRKGDLDVWRAESAIPASQYQYKQSPFAALGGLLGSGAKGLGSAAGGGGGGADFNFGAGIF